MYGEDNDIQYYSKPISRFHKVSTTENGIVDSFVVVNDTIYYVSDTKDIKKNIIAKLENMIIEKK